MPPFVLLLSFVLLLAAPPASGAPEDPLAAFGWLRDLAGACWTANLPDGRTTDTQCYEVRLDHFLHGTIAIGPAVKPAAGPDTRHAAGFRGEGLFARDRKTGRIVLTTWASDGGFATSDVILEGELIRFPQPNRTDPSAPVTSRTTWTRAGADAFRVGQEKLEDGAWTEKWSVVYRRVR